MYKNMQITEKELELNSLINESLASVMELSEKPKISLLNPVYVRNQRVVCRLVASSKVDEQLTQKKWIDKPLRGVGSCPWRGGALCIMAIRGWPI